MFWNLWYCDILVYKLINDVIIINLLKGNKSYTIQKFYTVSMWVAIISIVVWSNEQTINMIEWFNIKNEKVTTPCSQNLACLARLNSRDEWTIAETKLITSVCIGINRRFPFPPTYFLPRSNQAIFCNTFNQSKGGGVVATLGPVNLKNKRLQRCMLIWYHGIAMGLLFPFIPKKYNIPCLSSQWRHNCRFCPNWNKGQNWIFRPKRFEYRNVTGFFAYKRKKWRFYLI